MAADGSPVTQTVAQRIGEIRTYFPAFSGEAISMVQAFQAKQYNLGISDFAQLLKTVSQYLDQVKSDNDQTKALTKRLTTSITTEVTALATQITTLQSRLDSLSKTLAGASATVAGKCRGTETGTDPTTGVLEHPT